jgi:O-antigen biosynthesis protein
METLTQIFDKYNSDKNSSWHNYCRQYDSVVAEYRDKPIRLLEIGVFKGESLKVWREVFKNAIAIVGIDINNYCKQYENINNGIYVEIGNATNKEVVINLVKKYGPFDIIIDDGSHFNKDVIDSFEALFPTLNNNGLYIVEDTHINNLSAFTISGIPSHLEYFQQFLPYLNQSRPNDLCSNPFKIKKKTNNIFEVSIDSVLFGVGFIAIKKLIREHWLIK